MLTHGHMLNEAMRSLARTSQPLRLELLHVPPALASLKYLASRQRELACAANLTVKQRSDGPLECARHVWNARMQGSARHAEDLSGIKFTAQSLSTLCNLIGQQLV